MNVDPDIDKKVVQVLKALGINFAREAHPGNNKDFYYYRLLVDIMSKWQHEDGRIFKKVERIPNWDI